MDIQDMIEKRANLWNEAQNFLNEHTDKDGYISDEDAKAYDKMESDIIKLGKNIERHKRADAMNVTFSAPASKPIIEQPTNFFGTNGKNFKASNEYRQAALTALRTNFNKVSDYLQEGSDGLGGYLVPDEWDTRLIQALNDENVMRKLGTSITTSGERKINISGTQPAAAWVDEGASMVFSDTSFSQVTLGAHKLQVGIKVTNELLADNAYNLENHIINQFTTAISNAEEDAFLNGLASDTSKPTGLFPAASADTDTVVTTAGASIASDDIISLVYKLKRPYRKNAAFIMNDSTVATIRKLKDNNQAYMWQPSYQSGEPDRILGYPVYTSAYAPTIAAGTVVIAFGDISYYNIADRGQRSFKALHERYADNDQTAFLMIERVDGALLLPESVRVLKIKAAG